MAYLAAGPLTAGLATAGGGQPAAPPLRCAPSRAASGPTPTSCGSSFIVRGAATLAAAAAASSAARVSRRSLRGEDVAEEKLESQEVEAAVKAISRNVTEGQWYGNMICPRCGGGAKREVTFSAMLRKDGAWAYKCFRANNCGISGITNPISQHPDARDVAWSVSQLAEKLELQREGTGALEGEALRYLSKERKLDAEVLSRNHVGSFMNKLGTQVIGFPYLAGGRVVAEKYRALKEKKFWQAKGGQKELYGIDDIVDQRTIILVEGEIDKLSVETAGWRNCASVQGGALSGAAPGVASERALKEAHRVVLAMDNDTAGIQCADLLEKIAGKWKCSRVHWPEGCKDANDVLLKYGKDALHALIKDASQMKATWMGRNDDIYAEVQDRISGKIPDEMTRGVSTNWSQLDRHYRVVPQEVTVVTGKPGSGKSEFLLSLVMNLAEQHGWRFLLCAFEHSAGGLLKQLQEKRLKKHFRGMTDEEADKATDWLDTHFPLFPVGSEEPTIDKILDVAREQVTESGIRGVVIDPYNYIECSKEEAALMETHFISDLMSKLKSFARETGCHVWIVAHPSKNANWRHDRPEMYDVAGSSHWYNKCDMGLVVERVYTEDDGERHYTPEIRVHVQKVRNSSAGSLGLAELRFRSHERRHYDSYRFTADEDEP